MSADAGTILERRAARAKRAIKRNKGLKSAKKTVLDVVKQLPDYGRLLIGLMTDRRVGPFDKLLVGAALAYVVMPFDLIPDYIPFLGEVDDVYVLVLAVQRMLTNAGTRVVADHWPRSIRELSMDNLRAVLAAVAFFLPRRSRRGLRGVLRR